MCAWHAGVPGTADCGWAGAADGCLQAGEGSREHQIFEAVLNVIYEEFQFLHNFPDKELQMTAQVLASLVRTYLEMLRLESQDQSTPI